jgi:hypothetical protein
VEKEIAFKVRRENEPMPRLVPDEVRTIIEFVVT